MASKIKNTPGIAGGPRGRDRTLTVKRRKPPENQLFSLKKQKLPRFLCWIYLLLMTKYWGKQISHTKWVKSRRRREKKKD